MRSMIKTSELRVRDVINVLDGKRLGHVVDLEIDLDQGRVTALVVPGPARFFGLFGRDKDFVIPWENIVKIGVDVVLVEAETYTVVKSGRQRGERLRPGVVQGPWPEEQPH